MCFNEIEYLSGIETLKNGTRLRFSFCFNEIEYLSGIETQTDRDTASDLISEFQ